MKKLGKFSMIAAVALMLAPAAMAGGRKAGSVLIYPIVRSGGGFITVVSVTNTSLTPQTPGSLGGSTNVHFEYANVIPDPANVFCPLDCIVFDRVEFLTPADNLTVLTTCHNAFFPGGSQGYLVVSAQDPSQFDVPWSHNKLIGSELVLLPTGASYSLIAQPFNAVEAAGAATDNDGDGQLDFDGSEYEEIADVLMLDFFLSVGNANLSLINLTGGPRAENTILFQVWNDNEFLLSTTLSFKCWFDQPLALISPLFTDAFLALNTPNDPQELDINCDGNDDLETGWSMIDSILVTNNGGAVLDNDGAMVGALVSGPASPLSGGHLLWESVATQNNGAFVDF